MSSVTVASGSTEPRFEGFRGTWTGTNGFRLMPADELYIAAASAHGATAAAGHDLVLRYTWEHPVDGPQDGVLFVGSPDDQQRVTAAWGDSWHQQPAILILTGEATERGLDVRADYGHGWIWTIRLDIADDGRCMLTMHNVVPDDQATAAVEAGPYPVMVAELTAD